MARVHLALGRIAELVADMQAPRSTVASLPSPERLYIKKAQLRDTRKLASIECRQRIVVSDRGRSDLRSPAGEMT